MRADELVDQLHEGSAATPVAAPRPAGRLRAAVLAEFAEVGLPAAAVPYVVEVLRTELNPEVVAAAALAVRGWPGSDPELAAALVQAWSISAGAMGRPGRGRRGPRWSRCSPRCLAAVGSGRRWWRRWSGWVGSTARTGARRSAGPLAETLAALRGRRGRGPLALSAAAGSPWSNRRAGRR